MSPAAHARSAARPLVRRGSVASYAPARRRTLVPHTKHQGLELLHPADSGVCANHPDAIRRRHEQLEWQRQRMAERMHQTAMGNRKWYEAPSSMVSCGSADEFRGVVAQASREGRLLVAKFYTEECYVCKSIFPKMSKIAADNPDVLWCKLNGSDPELVSLFQSLGISKVPLFHMVLDGQLVAELTASLSPEKLAAFRAELAAHKPSPSPPSPASSGAHAAAPQAA